MEKLKYYILSFLVSTIVVFPLEAQIKHAEREVPDKVAEATPDTLSQLLQQMRKELDEMRSNESNLLMEVERWKLQAFSSDSLRLAKQRSRIDSIRNRTKGVAVVVEGDSLFFLYVKRGGLSPALRAEQVSEKISKLGRVYNLQPDSVYIESTDIVTEIMYEDKVLVSFTDQDGLWENLSRDDLARKYRTVIVQKLDEMKAEHSLWSLGKQILSFLAVVVIQILLIKLINWLYRKLKRRITRLKHSRLKPVVFMITNYLYKKPGSYARYSGKSGALSFILAATCNYDSYFILYFSSDRRSCLENIFIYMDAGQVYFEKYR